jgi:hypothetical protein
MGWAVACGGPISLAAARLNNDVLPFRIQKDTLKLSFFIRHGFMMKNPIYGHEMLIFVLLPLVELMLRKSHVLWQGDHG